MNEAFGLFKAAREYLTPVLTESAFTDRGMLTPEEFVRAGDQLVRTCPSWQWESGEKSKIKPYLPLDKQFLSTKGVPSYKRLSVLTGSKLVEETIHGEMGAKEGDWCAPNLLSPEDHDLDDDAVMVEVEDSESLNIDRLDLNDKNANLKQLKQTGVSSPPQPVLSEPDEYMDMEDASLALDEASTAAVASHSDSTTAKTGDNIVRSRRYDVSITYDNYYRTPRIWLFGFDESGSTLSTADIFQASDARLQLPFWSHSLFTGHHAGLRAENGHHRPPSASVQTAW